MMIFDSDAEMRLAMRNYKTAHNLAADASDSGHHDRAADNATLALAAATMALAIAQAVQADA